MAHFTAACEVACRLSPSIAPTGLAMSLSESVWKPAAATNEPDETPAPLAVASTPSRRNRRPWAPGASLPFITLPLSPPSSVGGTAGAGGNSRVGSPGMMFFAGRRNRGAADSNSNAGTVLTVTPESAPAPLETLPSAASSPLASSLPTLHTPDRAALESLQEMGFDDMALNRDILTACDHDPQRAVALLLGDEPPASTEG